MKNMLLEVPSEQCRTFEIALTHTANPVASIYPATVHSSTVSSVDIGPVFFAIEHGMQVRAVLKPTPDEDKQRMPCHWREFDKLH